MQSQIHKHIDLDDAIANLSTTKVLKVGWPEGKRYPQEQGGDYVAAIAAQNEYGAPHLRIPARPFMGPAISENKNKWLEIFRRDARKAIRGETTIDDIFEKVGAVAALDVGKAIRAVTTPVLSEVTIANRLKKLKKKKITESLTKPLIDTGYMLRTVNYVVEEE